MTDLTRLTIAEARAKLRGKEIKAVEITDAYLAAIDRASEIENAQHELVENALRGDHHGELQPILARFRDLTWVQPLLRRADASTAYRQRAAVILRDFLAQNL